MKRLRSKPQRFLLAVVCATLALPARTVADSPDLEGLGLTPDLVASVLRDAPWDETGMAPRDLSLERAREQAWELIPQGREEDALRQWAGIVTEKPHFLDAQNSLFAIAVFLMESTGDYDEACQLYRAAVAAHPGEEELELHARLWEIEIYFHASNLQPNDGIAALHALADEYAGSLMQGRVWLRLFSYYLEENDKVSADKWYQRAVTTYPSAPYVPWYAQLWGRLLLTSACSEADMRRDTGNYLHSPDAVKGLAELRRVVEWAEHNGYTPVLRESLYMLGEYYAGGGDWQKAISWYDELARRNPDGEWGANALMQVARCTAMVGDCERSASLCADVEARLASALWLKRRQLPVFERELQEIRALCDDSHTSAQ